MNNQPDQNDPVFERVASVVSEMFRIPPGVRIGPQTTSADIDGWDSLSHAVLIMKVEEAFGVDLALDRVYALKNVGELADLLRETTAAKA